MKKLFISFCVLFGTHMAMAEVIDAVSFNPSRLGRYEHLKVTEKLDSPGGVLTQAVTLQSGGTVTLNNAGNYKVTQATVHAADLSNTALNAQLMEVRGGKAVFGAGSISELESIAQTIRLKADSFSAYGTLSVSGVSQSDYDGNTIKGLSLGGNDIPHPGNCTSMKWVKRTDTSGAEHQVLAMLNCSNPDDGNEDPTCYGDTWYDSYSGMCVCDDEEAVWYNGACCSEYDKDNRTCWSEPYMDENCTSVDLGYEFMYDFVSKMSYGADEGESCDITDFGKYEQGCSACNASTEGRTCYEAGPGDEPNMCYLYKATCIHDYDEECVWDWWQDPYFVEGGANYYDPEEYPNGY